MNFDDPAVGESNSAVAFKVLTVTASEPSTPNKAPVPVNAAVLVPS